MDGDGRKAVATHYHGVFPGNFRAGGDLAERDHPPGDRAPDLQAVNRVDVTPLGERWTCNDRQQPRLLRKNATAAVSRFPIKADSASFKTEFQRPGHFHPGDSVAQRGLFEELGADDFFPLPPVLPHAHRAAIVADHLDGLVGEPAQLGRIGTTESRLDASALSRAEEKSLGDGVGVRVISVQIFLHRLLQSVDLRLVVHVDQELHVSRVLAFRGVNEQKAQAAAADERGDMSNPGLLLDELLNRIRKCFRFANMGARR